ncbi:chromatin accessibility complex protein 1 isoform X1 [Ixodes scapularis]|uniref:Chromatin accessibility complex protein 1 n=2 Tax=Ixodes TaxID=6944 RepID=A0A0K8RE53_IXORI|nr:chromatin accessibility complex protein 1 isoform X1 [Ixodes scapularis]
MEPKTRHGFPVSRIRTIMKSSPEVSCLGQDSVHITTKASEQFVALLVREAFKHSKDKKTVQYSDLAAVVDSQDRLDFLNDIIPRKVKFKDFLKYLKETEAEEQEREQQAEL